MSVGKARVGETYVRLTHNGGTLTCAKSVACCSPFFGGLVSAAFSLFELGAF